MAAPIVGSDGGDGTPGGGSTGLLGPLLLTFLVLSGSLLLFLFVRRRRSDDDGQPAGSFGLATAAAAASATAPMPVRAAGPSVAAAAAAAPKVAKTPKAPKPAKPAKPEKPVKAPRTRGVKPTGARLRSAAVAGATAAATTNADPADDSADLADPTSWEVSDDAPLAATSAAYAATQAAVAEPPTVHTFETPPAPGVERALVRGRLVRLSAEPDDFGSVEFGRLDRGDEVEIVDSFESYLYVRVPDGKQAGSGGPPAGLAARRFRTRLDPCQGAFPIWIDRAAWFVEVDQQRRVIGRDRRALARLAVDLGIDDACGHGRRDSRWSIRMPRFLWNIPAR